MSYLPCFNCEDPKGLWRLTGAYLCTKCWYSGNPLVRSLIKRKKYLLCTTIVCLLYNCVIVNYVT